MFLKQGLLQSYFALAFCVVFMIPVVQTLLHIIRMY